MASGRARRYDAVLLKLLGGSMRQILGAQVVEYALLSLVLVGVAAVFGIGAGWYVVASVFDIGFAPDWSIVAATMAAAVLVTLGVGVAGSLPAIRARPAEALRSL